MTLANQTLYKWMSSLLIVAAIALYILFQTEASVIGGILLLAAGVMIGVLTIPRGQRIQRAMFYVVAIPVLYFIRAFM